MGHKHEFQARTERIEELVQTIEGAADPRTQAVTLELMQSVMQLHGAALEKMMELISASPERDHVFRRFAEDELISSVLLLHDLHPEEMEDRIHRTLELLRPKLQSQGASIELLGLEDRVISLRIHGTADGGCHSASAASLKSEIEDAIYQAAPDALQILHGRG